MVYAYGTGLLAYDSHGNIIQPLETGRGLNLKDYTQVPGSTTCFDNDLVEKLGHIDIIMKSPELQHLFFNYLKVSFDNTLIENQKHIESIKDSAYLKRLFFDYLKTPRNNQGM